jgi:hypothetical protein
VLALTMPSSLGMVCCGGLSVLYRVLNAQLKRHVVLLAGALLRPVHLSFLCAIIWVLASTTGLFVSHPPNFRPITSKRILLFRSIK